MTTSARWAAAAENEASGLHDRLRKGLVTDLTAGERGMLDRCEATIARGLEEVGEALMEIKERNLYKAYGTFEDYCRERWQMSARHADRKIDAAKVATAIGPIGPKPTSEAVARELRPVMRAHSTEKVEEVWAEVVEEHGPTPTADAVRSVVERKLTRREKQTAKCDRRAASRFAVQCRVAADAEGSFPIDIGLAVEHLEATKEVSKVVRDLRDGATVLRRYARELEAAMNDERPA